MRLSDTLGLTPTWERFGLLAFNDHFAQRKIGKTFGRVRSLIPLPTASGAQWAESELEAKTIEQIAFLPQVYDLMTQVIVEYDRAGKKHTYTPDILVQLYADGEPGRARYVIEVKRQDALKRIDDEMRERFKIGREFAAALGAKFRIVTEAEIETPYLVNARWLRRRLGDEPDALYLDQLQAALAKAPLKWGDLASRLVAEGILEPDANDAIEEAITFRWIACDLSKHLSDETLLSWYTGILQKHFSADPFLSAIRRCSDGKDL